jgi:pimeloyl-ACP methyl ester carboxylesterase
MENPATESILVDIDIKLVETRIKGGGRQNVHADLRSASPDEGRPLIIVSHGFLGYRRWGFFPFLSERLAAAGFHVMTISFSRCGVDEATGRITNPELFASNSVGAEIEDLLSACEAARGAGFPLRSAGRPWGLMGHSRGGAVSILAAPRVPEAGSIVTWSALAKLDRYTDRRREEWKRTGRLPFNEGRADTGLWLDYSYYEDIDRNREAYDLPKRASELGVPHLIVHGRHDAAVTMKEERLLVQYPPRSERRFEIIEGCGHTFGARHPMRKPPAPLEKAAGLTVEWFRRTLAQGRNGL